MIHFTAPQWLYLLFLLPLLILAHLLYHRRRRLIVSSLLIWQQSSDRIQRSLAFRRLLNINLLLQSLTLVTAVLALAQPEVLQGDRRDDRPVVLILDRSAGMAVREEEGSRMDILRKSVSEMLSQLESRRETTVITCAARAEFIGRFTSDDRELRTIVSHLEATNETSDLASALDLARELYPDGEIHIFTDGAWDGGAVDIDRGLDHLHLLGTARGNAGFVHASATPRGSGTDFFALIGSYGLPELPATATLYAGDTIAGKKTVTLKENTTTEFLLSVPDGAASGDRWVLQLTSPRDSLEADNRAYLIPAQRRPLRIAWAGDTNPFLDSVLSVYPDSDMRHYLQYSPAVTADLVILDGLRGATVPEGRLLAIDSTIAGVHPLAPHYLSEGSSLEAATDHPIVAGIDLGSAYFERVFTVPPRDGLRPLLYHNDSYAGFTLETERLKVVSLNFDTTRTNLVLQNAFPLLIHNALSWLSGDLSRTEAIRTGETIHIDSMPGDAISVTTPRGERWSQTASGTSTDYTGTETAGIYSVERNGRPWSIAVNLFSRDETNTLPRVQATPVVGRAPRQRTLWRILTLAAIAFLAADTLLWSRKG